MEDVRERVELSDGWYTRRGEGRILSGFFGEPLFSELLGMLEGMLLLLSSFGFLISRRNSLLGDGPSGIVGRFCLSSSLGVCEGFFFLCNFTVLERFATGLRLGDVSPSDEDA